MCSSLQARKAYPGKRLHITNEIIHNPGALWGRSNAIWRCFAASATSWAAGGASTCCRGVNPAWLFDRPCHAGVNQRLKEMDVNFIEASEEGDKASQAAGGWLLPDDCCLAPADRVASWVADTGLACRACRPACCLLLACLHTVARRLGNTGHSRSPAGVGLERPRGCTREAV